MAAFVAANGWGGASPALLADDASFRRYFRLRAETRRAVLMDAPPPRENIGPYVTIAELLRSYGLSAPEIYAGNREHGFLLLEDFGDDTYTRLLARGADETALYTLAIDALTHLQRAVPRAARPDVPAYDEPFLLTEAGLLVEWYAPEVLGAPLPEAAREAYIEVWRRLLLLAELPPTLVLRDFHVDNLMLLPGRAGVRACGLLDFQDARWGPPSYDLVSLLYDARRDLPARLVAAMTERYLAAFPDIDRTAFRRSAAILNAQRSCKIVGLFTRLSRRDGKPQYLRHLPRVWRLIEEAAIDPVLAPLAEWLDRHIPKRLRLAPGPGRGVSAA